MNAFDDDLSLTEDGNALRLVARHGSDYRYCPERGRWLRWDGCRWAWDIAGQIRERTREMARALPEDSKDETSHRQRSLSAAGVSGTLRLAQTDARVVARLAGLDADPFALNTPSGTVDLRSGEVRPHRKDDLLTRVTPFSIEPSPAAASRFAGFVKTTFGGDVELAGYVQRLLGHSLVGVVTEHVLPFAYGAGANGKSVLMKLAMSVVGLGEDGYAVQSPSDFLMARTSPPHPTEIARLKGARLVVCQEINAGQRFDEAKVKTLTGGDPLAGRFMRQDFFSFAPTHHLWIVGNHRPEVRDGGPAFWRRIRLVPFEHVVPEGDRDPHLTEKLLEAEPAGILAWLVAGAVAAHRDGIGEPGSVVTATKRYELDEDTVARFLEEACAFGDRAQQHNQVRVRDLREAYESWCHEALIEPTSAKAFSQRVVESGAGEARSSKARYFTGVRLKPEFEAAMTDDR